MTKHKLQTQFQLFRYNRTSFHKSPITVEWFLYDENNEDDETRAFTHEELQQFINYAVQNTVNFPPDGKDHLNATDDDAPNCDLLLQSVSDENLNFPKNIILRRSPSINGTGIMHCMDIMLVNQAGEDSHRYDLPFDVVGRILR